ncbi:MAG: RdgB/HAM1 family non-canonical purine NTP pyrophosphatase [Duodenibacillus sp.]|nr:RdgB/HAM1 family non-canonical purine NTP pyrophosphatase [Duodenibacillus sp.]
MNERKLVLASGNKGKVREFEALFAGRGVEVISQGQLGVASCEEPYGTFLENALAKARNASRQTGLPAVADDSGITAEALQGLPGVHSARFAGEHGNDGDNNARLVAMLAGSADKRAHYTCVLVAVRFADDPEPVAVTARWEGEIVAEPRGSGGFGYDPHFYLPGCGMTAAELPAEEKNAVSHRGKALRKLMDALAESWGW